jgi:rubredoxin
MSEAAIQADPVQWMCLPCGHVYDPAEGDPGQGIPAGTRFEDVDASYACPVCGVGTDEFQAI